MAIKVMCNSAENFTLINNAIEALETENAEFMSHFCVAEQLDIEGTDVLNVVLKNNTVFSVDLNRGRKYVIQIPETLIVDAIDFVPVFDKNPKAPRVPSTNVLLQAHLADHNISFLFVLTGFVSNNIRIIRDPNAADDLDSLKPAKPAQVVVHDMCDCTTHMMPPPPPHHPHFW